MPHSLLKCAFQRINTRVFLVWMIIYVPLVDCTYTLEQKEFSRAGARIQNEQIAQLQSQLETFKSQLQTFASKYAKEIRQDPVFRSRFTEMCTSIGVCSCVSDNAATGRPFGFTERLLGRDLGCWRLLL